MRKVLSLAAVALVLWAVPPAANPVTITPGGAIDLSSGSDGVGELIVDAIPGLLMVYVVHRTDSWGSATACQFSAPKPACFTGTYLSDQTVFPVTIGNSQTGVSIGYGSCRQSLTHVLTMMFFGLGTTECCFYPVLPDPNEPGGQIVTVDCSQQLVPVKGGATIVNYRPGCYSVPAEETSWGKVKSLYTE